MDLNIINFDDKYDNYKLMHRWCSQKFVYEWFEQRILSFHEIVEKYKAKLLFDKQKLYIINFNEKPIGFVQIYKYEDRLYDKLKKYKNIYEYDLFIGEEEYLSKGIGTMVVNMVNNYIYDHFFADCIILRPFKRNVRAIKCYEKNNFKIIYEYDGIDSIGNDERFVVLLNESINKL